VKRERPKEKRMTSQIAEEEENLTILEMLMI
jgi:hypothetical protein